MRWSSASSGLLIGMPRPLSAVAVRELTEVTRRADNALLLGALPDLGVDVDEMVADLEVERARR